MILNVHVFESAKEYCTFLKVLMRAGLERAASGQIASADVSKRIGYGYAIKYNGKYGKGWKVVIFNKSAEYHGNNKAIYYVSNQLDRKDERK